MAETASELLHGTLETLILKTLTGAAATCYGIARAIETRPTASSTSRKARSTRLSTAWNDASWSRRNGGVRARPAREVLSPHRAGTPPARRPQTAEWTRFAGAISKVLLAGTSRFYRWPWKVRVEDEVDEELAFHVDMRISELRARGLSEQEARREATRRFGDFDRMRACCARWGPGGTST